LQPQEHEQIREIYKIRVIKVILDFDLTYNFFLHNILKPHR